MSDTLYVATTGCTCYLDGQRGTVTGLHNIGGTLVGAFVKTVDGPMVYCNLTAADDESHRTVVAYHKIDREEFDRITGLDADRVTLGWVA